MEMFFGAQLHGNSTTFDDMTAVAQAMDRGRWHSAWTYDHFVPPEDFLDERDPSLEGWTTLTY